MKLFTMLYQARWYRLAGFAAMSVATTFSGTANAQSPVTAVFTHKENALTATTYTGTGATGSPASGYAGNSYTYQFGLPVASSNNTAILDSFTALGLNYHYQPENYQVKIRRVNNSTVTGFRKLMRIEQTGGTVTAGGSILLLPEYNDSLEQVFSQRIFNVGVDNIFQNDDNSNNINIERVDMIFPNGIDAADNTRAGFVVFDWGAAGDHDPFYMAAIKTLDVDGNPSSYYDAVSVTKNNYGSGAGGNCTYVILRKNDTDARLLFNHDYVTQTRDGVFFRFGDLGVSSNTPIYGYSLFAADGQVSPAAKMVDYTNATNFPITSDLSGGGPDLLTVAGLWVTDSLITLPNQVSEWRAAVVNNQVKLSWDLNMIDGLKEQVVERSENGITYIPILHIPVQAEGLQTALDIHPMSGKNYYRLKLVQQDGIMVTCSAVSMVDLKPAASVTMSVYPNPVKNNFLKLEIRGLAKSSYTIHLLNINGQPLLRQLIVGEQTVQKSLYLPKHIAAGAYILKLTDENGKPVCERRILIE